MKEAYIINKTPHTIYYSPDAYVLGMTIPPDPEPARVSVTQETVPYPNVVRGVREVYGEVTGLPEPEEGVYYIVSLLVQQQCPDRRDLLSPTDFIRNDKGEIVGCRAFRVNF